MKLSETVAKAKERFGMPASARENEVVDAASIEVSRKAASRED